MQAEQTRPTISRAAAERVVKRYNTAMFAIVGAWFGVVVLFWARALGPLRPYDIAVPETSVWIWLVGGTIAGACAAFLPRAYYRPRPFETRGRFYTAIGMKGLRSIITDGDIVNRAARRKDPSYTKYGSDGLLRRVLAAGLASEKSHHALWWFGVATCGCALAAGWFAWAVLLGVGNVVANLLPMALQRYTRARVSRLKPDFVLEFLYSKGERAL